MKIRNILFTVCFATLFSCATKEESCFDKDEIMFGIDISQYQTINWDKLANQEKHPIEFIVVRATMGTRQDVKFLENFKTAKEKGFIVGTYHYYDPNENSSNQAENYIKSVGPLLQKGDFIPILDIERLSKIQSKKRLLQGIQNWLTIVERKFGVKPMIYSNLSFFNDHLSHFKEHPLWVAAYSSDKKTCIQKIACIHQFTENVRIHGVKECVDGNDLKRKDFPKIVFN